MNYISLQKKCRTFMRLQALVSQVPGIWDGPVRFYSALDLAY
jgi:hypothetical protein